MALDSKCFGVNKFWSILKLSAPYRNNPVVGTWTRPRIHKRAFWDGGKCDIWGIATKRMLTPMVTLISQIIFPSSNYSLVTSVRLWLFFHTFDAIIYGLAQSKKVDLSSNLAALLSHLVFGAAYPASRTLSGNGKWRRDGHQMGGGYSYPFYPMLVSGARALIRWTSPFVCVHVPLYVLQWPLIA